MHLSLETAADFAEGRMDNLQKEFWMNHTANCPSCAKQIQEWRQLRKTLRRAHLVSAPADLIEKAVKGFQGASQVSETKEPFLKRLIATVTFDSFAQPALAGTRGAAVSDARQLVLESEMFDIHAKIWTDQDQRHLDGQILPRGEESFFAAARLHLLRDGSRMDSTSSDGFGEFQFKDIPKGVLGLQIDLPHLTVVGILNANDGKKSSPESE